jgi:hypothetical protein
MIDLTVREYLLHHGEVQSSPVWLVQEKGKVYTVAVVTTFDDLTDHTFSISSVLSERAVNVDADDCRIFVS